MAVKLYTPGLQVTLIKLVTRTNGTAGRFAAARRDIDLTPLLGEDGEVRTGKSLSRPEGTFTIAFGDQPDGVSGDTLYAMIEPMDMIEIRAAREPSAYIGQPLPLIMRGFVSSIRRDEAVESDGSPRRSVVIQGQDAGKLWVMNQIYFEIAIITDNAYLNAFQLQVATGIDVATLPVSEFMRQLVQKVMNAKIAKLAAASQRDVKPFIVDATVKQGVAMPQRAASFDQVPVWSLAEAFADRPWNELFIQDQEDGPHFVFRPAPYKDIAGQFIMPDAVDPGTIVIDSPDIVDISLARSDARVANFFWVPPGDSMLDSDMAINVASLLKGEPLDFKYGNNAPELYGVRKMQVQTSLLPDGLGQPPAMLAQDQRAPAVGSILLWHEARARLLKLMNRDNSAFEEGNASVKGNEGFQIGRYLRIYRGGMVSENYIQAVSHSFAPLGNWTTSLSLIRGSGFLARARSERKPFYAEGRDGPYSPAKLLGGIA